MSKMKMSKSKSKSKVGVGGVGWLDVKSVGISLTRRGNLHR